MARKPLPPGYRRSRSWARSPEDDPPLDLGELARVAPCPLCGVWSEGVGRRAGACRCSDVELWRDLDDTLARFVDPITTYRRVAPTNIRNRERAEFGGTADFAYWLLYEYHPSGDD